MGELFDRLAKLSPAQRRLLEQRLAQSLTDVSEPIALVGMACRFPQAPDLQSYWRLILEGVDATGEIPPDRWDVDAYYDPDPDKPGKMSTRWGGFIDGVDLFDPVFFGISPREAARMDPQQRVLLEVAWEALENAGVAPERLAGSKTGVFVGIGATDYSKIPTHFEKHLEYIDAHAGTGNALSIAANRISYVLDLRGPSLSVDTACSSALLAVHLAVQSLRARESDMALVGGVNLILSPEVMIAFSKARMLSPTGKCRPFDAAADGYVRGEGCGVIVLKRLTDAIRDEDHVWAVIRGSAANQDGKTSGITAPNSRSQHEVIRAALANAGLEASQVSYIEAHGTGTPLGDPIEIQGLQRLFRRSQQGEYPCWLTSVKANIGHTETASGIAGLIKVALMMRHEIIPGQLHLRELNPNVRLEGTRLIIPREPMEWEPLAGRRIAGVSSFGFGGTNVHVIVEEVGPRKVKVVDRDRSFHLLTLSAKSSSSLQHLARRYREYLENCPDEDLPNVCYTANSGRNHFNQRLAICAASRAQMARRLDDYLTGKRQPGVKSGQVKLLGRPKIVFLFTGQGSQYVGMGRKLWETCPPFREALEQCDAILRPHLPVGLLDVLYPQSEEPPSSAALGAKHSQSEGVPLHSLLDETLYTQPALFALEYALAKLWLSWGIEPDYILGHSVGEYVAACIAGVFSLEDGLRLITERARLMAELPRDGMMAVIFASEEVVRPHLEGLESQVSVAAINGPTNTVISGKADLVSELAQAFEKQGINTHPLAVSHAFHSPLMDPILDTFEDFARQIPFQEPRVPIVSNVTGEFLEGIPDARYWRNHIRHAVLFAQGVECLHAQRPDVWLELGPAPILLGMARRCVSNWRGVSAPSLRKGHDDWEVLLDSFGELYLAGARIDWKAFDQYWPRKRCQLPTYPFERSRYWFEPKPRRTSLATAAKGPVVHPLLGVRVPTALPQRIYENQISQTSPAYLKDHRLQGTPVVPAAFYAEIGLAIARELFGPGKHTVEDLSLQHALFLPENAARIVQVAVSEQAVGVASFEVFSAPADATDGQLRWTLHACGRIRSEANCPDGEDLPAIDLDRFDEQVVDVKSREEFYQLMGARQLQYGPLFQGLDRLRRRRADAIAHLQPPPDVERQASDYLLHPAWLDASLQITAGVVPLGADGQYNPHTFLPTYLGQLRNYRPPHEAKFAYAVRRSPDQGPATQVVEADVFWLDSRGQVVVEIRGLRVERVGRTELESEKDRLKRLVYRVAWRDAGSVLAGGMQESNPRRASYPSETEHAVRAGTLSAHREGESSPPSESSRLGHEAPSTGGAQNLTGVWWILCDLEIAEQSEWAHHLLSHADFTDCRLVLVSPGKELKWRTLKTPKGLLDKSSNSEPSAVNRLGGSENQIDAETSQRASRLIHVTIDPGSPNHWNELESRLRATGLDRPRGVIYLWGLRTPAARMQNATFAELQRLKNIVLSGLLQVSQHLLRSSRSGGGELIIVSQGGQSVPPGEVNHSARTMRSEGDSISQRLADASRDDLPGGYSSEHVDPFQAPLWGFGRSLVLEHPELRCRLIDVDPVVPVAVGVAQLLAEIQQSDEEIQVAIRSDRRFVPRLIPAHELIREGGGTGQVPPSKGPFRVRLGKPGSFDALGFEKLERLAPTGDRVEIEVRADGLNFSDVLKALGLYPGITDPVVPLGIECAGVVTAVGEEVSRFKPGDEVLGVAPYSFASHALSAEYALVHKPSGLSFQEAATIPISFLTAYYALVWLGRLQPDERVLIHAGAGGVGLAAIQIAQHIGAEIFTTAGSEEKRKFLRSLGVSHVLDSRSLSFADEIRRITRQEGVDVVLNSLPGDAITESLRLLRAYGRFLEIGKTDIYQNRMIGLLPFQDNLSYFAIDLDRMLRQRPQLIRQLFAEIMERFAEGSYRPLPLTEFPVEQLRAAFRYMAQRKNIGKIVISLSKVSEKQSSLGVATSHGKGATPEHPAPTASTIEARTTPGSAVVVPSELGIGKGVDEKDFAIRPDATYLITGGLGALGLKVAEWLVRKGARHLALMARRSPGQSTREILQAMEQQGARFYLMQVDVSDHDAVARELAKRRGDFPPLRGVIHAAGVLADGLLPQMNKEQLLAPIRPKVDGAWNLHDLTKDDPLDFFIMFSSVAGVLGSPGQTNYAAANAFLDALAVARQAAGLPAISICWGPWAEVGMAIDSGAQRIAARGMRLLSPSNGLALLEALLQQPRADVVVIDADWARVRQVLGGRKMPLLDELSGEQAAPEVAEQSGTVDHEFLATLRSRPMEERKGLLVDYFGKELARIMGLEAGGIDPDQPLSALGMDSLMAMELKNNLEARLAFNLPMAAFVESPSLSTLADLAAKLLTEQSADVLRTETGQKAAWSPIVPLGKGDGRPPLFCIHPLGGDFRCYQDLAAELSEHWPICALRARGAEGVLEPHHSLDEMIEEYWSAIRSYQPTGPYFLAGWSAGGIYAFALARRLLADGADLGRLIFFDTPVPDIYEGVDLGNEARFLCDLVQFTNHFTPAPIQLSYDELRNLQKEAVYLAALEQAKKQGAVPAGASPEFIRRLCEVAREHVRFVLHYELRPIEAEILMFLPAVRGKLAELSGKRLDADLGWGKVSGQRFRIIEVPGDHFSMMNRPNVTELAQHLLNELEQALRHVSLAQR